MLLSALIAVGLFLGLLATLWIGRFVTPVAGALGFLVLLLAPMAALNLARYMQEYGPGTEALGFWEGGIWLSACVPLAALAVATRCPVTDTQAARTGTFSMFPHLTR